MTYPKNVIDANSANLKTHHYNSLLKPLESTFNAISEACEAGDFQCEIVVYESSTASGLKEALEKLGYRVRLSSEQISPNESNYHVDIDWREL